MADAANQRQFNLRGDIRLEEILALLTDLNSGSDAAGSKILKKYLQVDTYPKTSLERFEVTYIPEKFNDEGYIDPHSLHRILISVQKYLHYYATKVVPGLFANLPKKDTTEYEIFYFQGKYSPAVFTPTNKSLQKDVISTLFKIANSFKEVDEEEESGSLRLDNISELSYSFRQGNLEENWVNERGVKKFVELLISLPVQPVVVVEGKDFGRGKEVYAFEHALDALSEYHRRFKEILPGHPNYNQPKEEDLKVLQKVESENYPYFNRGIFAATLITSHQLGGKIESDNQRLKEFLELFDKVVKILKKKVEKPAAAGEAASSEGGEAETEPEKKEDKKAEKILEFEDFYQIAENTLIQFIYESLYEEEISKIDSINSRKIEARNRLISLISQAINETINLKLELRAACGNGALSEKYKDEKISYDSEVESWLVEYCQSLLPKFDDKKKIAENINLVVAYLAGVRETEEEKPKLSTITSASVSPLLYQYCQKNKIISEGTTFETWEKSITTDRVNYWMSLNTHQRYEFLVQNNLLNYLQSYSVDISNEFLQLYLAKNHLSRVRPEDFAYILNMIQESVFDELIDIPPTEYEASVDTFINNHQTEVLLIQESISVRYGFTVQRAVDDYVVNNSQDILLEQIRGKSIEEAAAIVNPEIKNIDTVIHSASEGVLEILYQTYKFPNEVKLEGIDRSRSMAEIEIYLKDYLLSHPEALRYLFSATPTQRQLFFNRQIHDFWNEKSVFFAPLIEERGNERHRQVILERLTQQAGGSPAYQIQLNNNLRYIFAQAIIAQVNPEDYLANLSDQDLAQLFDLPKGFDDYEEFKKLLLLYVERSRKTLGLDKIIDRAKKDFDKDEFTEDLLYLREQGYRVSPQRGGDVVLGAIVTPLGSDEEQQIDDEYDIIRGSLDDEARQNYERQRLMTMAIWEAYTAEQRAIIEAEAQRQNLLSANELAVYDWAKLIDQYEKNKGVEEGKRTKPDGIIKKGLKRGADKVAVAGTTAAAGAIAGAIIPGAGGALTGFINALPISDKYKKYISTGILGGLIGFVAVTVKLFLTTAGGFIGGILGGIGGFLVAGPAGIIPGMTAGTWAGYGIEQAIKGFFGDLGTGISNIANSIGSGISNAANGLANGVKGAWNSIFGSSSSAVGTSGAFSSIPLGAQAAVPSTLLGGTMIISTIQHNAYLERPPELLSYSQDTSAKYVQVQKTASPSELDNGETADITYTITITPAAGYSITVSEVTDEITTIGGGKTDYEVDLAQITSQLPANTVISSPTTITYTLPGVTGTDISINNDFQLTFFTEDAGEIKTDTARDTANVTIGDPELGCFVFGESGIEVRAGSTVYSTEWSAADRAKVVNAYGEILDSSGFMNRVCRGGKITFYIISGNSYGGWALSSNSIGIYDLGLTSQNSANYTVIHELGHLIDYRNPGLRTSFQAIWGGSCFTYPYDCYAGEPFAEAVALYSIYSYYNFRRLGGTYNFPTLHPTEYNWVGANIYGSN